MKYVVVTGGVMSGQGKGIVSASIGKILKSYGLKVGMLKIDGYLNVDPGTLNPYEHGEVFVLDDGTETDLDLGHYERFLNLNLDKDSSVTNGKIYKKVIDNERKGIYLGKTVQIIPHVTDVIIEHGDMENMVFLEALRQLSIKEKVVFVHLSYIPISSGNEQKTKPTQHSIRNLLQLGIYPDIIIGRCGTDLRENTKNKISLFGGVEKESVISDPDAEIYELPLLFDRQNLGNIVMNKLGIEINQDMEKNKFKELKRWKNLVKNLKNKSNPVSIGVIGKYAHLEDAYLSIKEAVKHIQMNLNIPVNFEIVEAESENLEEKLKKFDGIIVPGGFGIRGIKGKIRAVNFCRVNKVPFLGMCLGFQLAVIEFARNVCSIDSANTSEVDKKCPNPVIDLLFEQKEITDLGGTMRLGAYPCVIKSNTLAHKIYNRDTINRRYRHRYGLNLKYKEILERNGINFSGTSPDGKLMEILELSREVHPFFVALQYHPEFSSRPEKPEELFVGLVNACVQRKSKKKKSK
ncbi:MAG: CTP synthase [Candidatus Altiarchaeum hamiconexum]|nr:CTP synthase [Candidatus Altarchaeum hamiconexum]